MTDDEIAADVDRFVNLMEHSEKCRWERAQPPTPTDEALARIAAMREGITSHRQRHGTQPEPAASIDEARTA